MNLFNCNAQGPEAFWNINQTSGSILSNGQINPNSTNQFDTQQYHQPGNRQRKTFRRIRVKKNTTENSLYKRLAKLSSINFPLLRIYYG